VNAYACNCKPGYAGVNCQSSKYFIYFEMYVQLAGLVLPGFQFLNDVYMLCHSIFMQTSTNVPVIPVLTEGRALTR